VYVSGLVVLDAPDLLEVSDVEGRDAVAAVIRHELGHVVGLDHVDDEQELMSPVIQSGVVTFGPGDLTGLAELGRGQCFPEV
jgi:predicted Zn-dependent protease